MFRNSSKIALVAMMCVFSLNFAFAQNDGPMPPVPGDQPKVAAASTETKCPEEKKPVASAPAGTLVYCGNTINYYACKCSDGRQMLVAHRRHSGTRRPIYIGKGMSDKQWASKLAMLDKRFVGRKEYETWQKGVRGRFEADEKRIGSHDKELEQIWKELKKDRPDEFKNPSSSTVNEPKKTGLGKMELKASAVSVKVDEKITVTLTVETAPADDVPITLSQSVEGIVKFEVKDDVLTLSKGETTATFEVTGVKEGKTSIKATNDGNKSNALEITVEPKAAAASPTNPAAPGGNTGGVKTQDLFGGLGSVKPEWVLFGIPLAILIWKRKSVWAACPF